MEVLPKLNTRYKAASLVEILVVLAIVASSMVAVANVNIQAQISLKDNEIIDAANGVMIQALEVAKSPSQVSVVDPAGNLIPGNIQGYYSLDLNSGSSQGVVLRKQTFSNTKITNCNSTSPYLVDWTTNGVGATSTSLDPNVNNICVQVIITEEQRPLIVDTYYKIESIVIFNISDGQESNSIIGYRRDDYAL